MSFRSTVAVLNGKAGNFLSPKILSPMLFYHRRKLFFLANYVKFTFIRISFFIRIKKINKAKIDFTVAYECDAKNQRAGHRLTFCPVNNHFIVENAEI